MSKIIGHGAPTANTPGSLGSEYFDKDSKQVYTCVKSKHKTAFRAGESDNEYEWVVMGGGASSWNDLKDKPFYKDSKLLYDYLWEIKGVETTPVEGYDKSKATLTTFPDTSILPRDKIIVDFNGVIYETKFRPAGYGNTIGNGILGGYGNNEHDNEPFGLSYGRSGMHLNTSEPGIYDVKVYALEETIKPLDVEFLPEGYPKTVRVQSTLVDNMEFTGDYIEYLNISLLKDVQYTVIYDNEEYLSLFVLKPPMLTVSGGCFDI